MNNFLTRLLTRYSPAVPGQQIGLPVIKPRIGSRYEHDPGYMKPVWSGSGQGQEGGVAHNSDHFSPTTGIPEAGNITRDGQETVSHRLGSPAFRPGLTDSLQQTLSPEKEKPSQPRNTPMTATKQQSKRVLPGSKHNETDEVIAETPELLSPRTLPDQLKKGQDQIRHDARESEITHQIDPQSSFSDESYESRTQQRMTDILSPQTIHKYLKKEKGRLKQDDKGVDIAHQSENRSSHTYESNETGTQHRKDATTTLDRVPSIEKSIKINQDKPQQDISVISRYNSDHSVFRSGLAGNMFGSDTEATTVIRRIGQKIIAPLVSRETAILAKDVDADRTVETKKNTTKFSHDTRSLAKEITSARPLRQNYAMKTSVSTIKAPVRLSGDTRNSAATSGAEEASIASLLNNDFKSDRRSSSQQENMTVADFSPRATQAEPTQTLVVKVSIGRIEIRPTAAAPRPVTLEREPRRRGPAVSLSDYLNNKRGGE